MYGVQVRDIEGSMKSIDMKSLVRHIHQINSSWYYLEASECVVVLSFTLSANSKYTLTEIPFADVDRIPSYGGSIETVKVYYTISGNQLRMSFSAISSNYFYGIKDTHTNKVRISKLVIEYV